MAICVRHCGVTQYSSVYLLQQLLQLKGNGRGRTPPNLIEEKNMALGFIKQLVGPVSGLVSEFIEDKDQANKLAHEIATLAEKQHHAEVMAQVEVNKQEAAHKSLFVAGWRPAIGWICGLGMLSNFIIVPMTNFVLALLESPVVVPLIELETMMPVLLGMLGLGGMRSYEKAKGVARTK